MATTLNNCRANITEGGGSGDITGPGSSTDNALAIWAGTDGDELSDSSITVDTGHSYFTSDIGIGVAPASELHVDAGNATESYLKFTAGTTTGQTASDGFDVGVSSAGAAEIRQREDKDLSFFVNNTEYMRIENGSNAGRVLVGDPAGGAVEALWNHSGLKFTNNFAVTDIDKILTVLTTSEVEVTPSGDTNSGAFGIAAYASMGFKNKLLGSNDFNGGIAFNDLWTGNAVSCIGAAGFIYNETSGSVDGALGVYCQALHRGGGSATTTMTGGAFTVATKDDAGSTGSLTNAYGGYFTAVVEDGVSITNAVGGYFDEPRVVSGGNSITNKTACYVDGTLSVEESTVASAASITGMAVDSSVVYLTGSTATTIHGITADTFNKHIWIINQTGQDLTLAHQSGTETTAANRIITDTGSDRTTVGNGTAHLYYSSEDDRWILMGMSYTDHSVIPTIYGSEASGGDLVLGSTSNATQGDVTAIGDNFIMTLNGNDSTFNESNSSLRIQPQGGVLRLANAAGTAAGSFYPHTDGAGTLGSNGLRWNTVFSDKLRVTNVLAFDTPGTNNFTADNQTIPTSTDFSYWRLSSDDGTASNRTFGITSAVITGTVVMLEWNSSNAGELISGGAPGGATIRFAGGTGWTPTQYDTICLIWNGSEYIELYRSANS